MAAPLVATGTPGIYKRGSRYVIAYRDVQGKQRRESFATMREAREAKRQRDAARDRGELIAPTRETLAEYARQWIATYQGKGRGFREHTREDYSRHLERYVLPFLGHKRLTAIRHADVRDWIAWLCDDDAQRRRQDDENRQRVAAGLRARPWHGPLKDASVARIVAVLSACMSSAVLDDRRPDNPVARAVLPKRDALPMPGDEDDADAGNVKALTRAELATFLAVVHPQWRPFFRLLAATGLRLSEAIALDVRHLDLTPGRPRVRVRRALVDGRFDRPKSEHGVRDVPLPAEVAAELRAHVGALPEVPEDVEADWGHLVFPSAVGTPVRPENLRRRVLRPAAEEAGAPWAGFHAFRHTFASLHIERGTNIVRLSRLLGHHKPSFTLDVYSHMLDDGYGEPLDLDAELTPKPDADRALGELLASAA